jgi:hypothetical protein
MKQQLGFLAVSLLCSLTAAAAESCLPQLDGQPTAE